MDSLSCKDCFTNAKSTFRHLKTDETDVLSMNRDTRVFKKGHIIYQEGMKLRGAYCIQKGIIKVFKTGIEGKEQIIKFAKSRNGWVSAILLTLLSDFIASSI